MTFYASHQLLVYRDFKNCCMKNMCYRNHRQIDLTPKCYWPLGCRNSTLRVCILKIHTSRNLEIQVLNFFKPDIFKALQQWFEFTTLTRLKYTIRSWTNRLLASVWYKTGTFQLVVVTIKGLPLPRNLKASIPLLRAFKWGTVCKFTSKGVKTARN